MKKYLGLMLLSVAMLFSNNVFAAGIAYVDVAEVFDNYQKTKDQDLALKNVGEQKEKERAALVKAIRGLEDEMSLLAKEARQQKQEQLIEKKRQLEDFDREIRRQLGEGREKVVREIFQDIDATIAAYGKEKGYDFILNDRVLLYRNPTLNITKAILEVLMKKYKKA